MKYKICKMQFKTGVHIGNGMLTDASPVFLADTLFSALCHEAGGKGIEELVKCCIDGKLKISDAMPYIGDTYYLPKPILTIRREDNGSSRVKKAFKKLLYIPADQMDQYMRGNLDAEKERIKLNQLGLTQMTQKVSVTYEKEPQPYMVGVYHFYDGNGLYVIVEYEDKTTWEMFVELIKKVSYSGIGGKRSAGYGKFTVNFEEISEGLQERLQCEKYKKKISLSFSLPKEEEMEKACERAAYQLKKRSGFVSSQTYANTFQKKKDFYGFASGSCVENEYRGDIYDVSIHGSHPVYEYAIPMFMGVI